MKRILVIALLFAPFVSEGQQMSQFTHFVMNYFQINPAVAGSAPCLDLKLGYRHQWQGFEGAPTTAFASLHGNFGKKKNTFHGIGGLVETDDTGPISYTSMHVAYAYHMKVSRKAMLSAGVSAGFAQYRVDYGAMRLVDYSDPAVQGSFSQFIYPQINFGLWWYSADRYLGFAIRNLVENRVDDFGLEAKLKRDYSIAGGKIIEMSDDFEFQPAFLLKVSPGSKIALDVQTMIDYKDKVAVGLGFRGGNGLAALIKIDMFKYVTLGYAYDLTLSKVRFDGTNTHEIIIGIQACAVTDSRSIPCAAYD
jgi:type IX secretion system PorP/SprF family membrane protein